MGEDLKRLISVRGAYRGHCTRAVKAANEIMNSYLPILGDPGAVSGGGKKPKWARKNSGEEKSRRRRRAPGDKVLRDQFQTVRLVLASDWCQKNFVFFCPIAEQQDQESFHDRYIQASCSPCYSRRKVSITAQNVGEICSAYTQETRHKSAGPFPGIVTLADLTD